MKYLVYAWTSSTEAGHRLKRPVATVLGVIGRGHAIDAVTMLKGLPREQLAAIPYARASRLDRADFEKDPNAAHVDLRVPVVLR